MIEAYFTHLNKISVAFVVGAFVVFWIHDQFFSEYEIDLEKLIGNSLAAATIPTGIALLICAFNSDLVTHLSDLHMHLAVAGIVLLYVAVRAIGKAWE